MSTEINYEIENKTLICECVGYSYIYHVVSLTSFTPWLIHVATILFSNDACMLWLTTYNISAEEHFTRSYDCGHYFAYVRKGSDWYLANDAKVYTLPHHFHPLSQCLPVILNGRERENTAVLLSIVEIRIETGCLDR